MRFIRVCQCGATPITKRADPNGMLYRVECVKCGATPPDGPWLTSETALDNWNEWRRRMIQ